MVRLVKGAYWDTEIKRAQVEGLGISRSSPARRPPTSAIIGCARKLLGMTDRIYPQFATHNAHTVAAVLEMAKATRPASSSSACTAWARRCTRSCGDGTRCRIYAPVGAHRDLLAYLVRRLLENGANSSFVNQIVDEACRPTVAACPFAALERPPGEPAVRTGPELFAPDAPQRGGLRPDRPRRRFAASRRARAVRAGAAGGRPMLAGPVEGGDRAVVATPPTG
jgi:RHH-type proline utilization regulon transcriptional repressor/proline dehydrogenase/delta 1-pyrroline-5-carboxylate dehydrogenase